MTSDILDDIKKEILSKLPDEIQVSKVEFEGPEVVFTLRIQKLLLKMVIL